MNKRKLLLWVAVICLLAMLLPTTALAASGNWSKNADGSWSYYDSYYGVWLTDGIYDIDGDYYCFDAAGKMLASKWDQDEYGNWYYYNNEGKQCRNGVYLIDGKYYGFNWDGQMYKDCAFNCYDSVAGDWFDYRAKADGSLYASEWYEMDDGYHYYGKDGKMCKNTVYLIDGKYYGFNWNGRMYKDDTFAIDRYSEESEKWIYTYYRAREDGTLYANQWYETEWGEYYYYGAGGAAYQDFQKVNGTWYFFHSNGRMAAGERVYSEAYGKNYIISEDGTSYVEMPSKGWFKHGEDYYYLKDNQVYESGIYEIEGKRYAFNWNGRMYSDESFSFGAYNEETGYWEYKHYRAREDGTLYVNQWYKTNGGDYYYYGAGGAAYKDFQQVNGKWYFFYSDGRMASGEAVYSEAYGKNYIIGEDGTSYVEMPVNGWITFEGNYYYAKENQLYTSGVYAIEGKYYAFNWVGKMYTNESFELYDSEVHDWRYYRAKGDGSLYVNAWYQESGEYYYYGEGGRAPRYEVLAINGKYYGFSHNGRMYKDRTFSCGGADYRAKADGSLYVNEWYKSGSNWYYYGANGVAASDFVAINGKWYFFNSSGLMVKEQLVYSELYGAHYVISADGMSSKKVTSDGWVAVGSDYYYIKDGNMVSGEVLRINGKYYGFSDQGWMYKDTSFHAVYDTGSEWIYGYFRAKADGCLYVNEWYNSGANWYYYGANGVAASDFVAINGTWYFFNGNGRMVKGELVYSDLYEAYYVISADGMSSKKAPNTGWVAVGDDYYYMQNGQLVEERVIKVDGKYYGFDGNGRMYKDQSFGADYNNGSDWEYDYFRAKADGSLYVNAWCKENFEWYYYGANGVAANDFVAINGTWYFFDDGRMVKNELVYSGLYDAHYIISADGKSSKKAPNTGWVTVGSDYYYMQDGEMANNEVLQIGGKYYGFDWDGVMYANEYFEAYDSEAGMYYYYRAKADGSLYVNTWYQEGSNWYYYGESGRAPRGYTKLDNAYYYFEYAGRMLTSSTCEVSGVRYAFGPDGKQVTAKGKQDIGSYYVYVKENGALACDEWVQIGSKWYYFMPEMVANTLFEIDNELYAVDNAGACVKVTGNGIYNIGIRGKVYLEGGKISEGWKLVGNAWYYFNDDMYSNGVYEIDDAYYVFDQNGKMFTGGWLRLGNSVYYGGYSYYVYADSNGKAATGLKTIGGKQYYFGEYGGLYTDTIVNIDGVEYAVDKSGVASAVGKANGWKLVGGEYYYLQNGKPVKNELKQIDGKWYYFDYDGVMCTNTRCYYDGDMIAGADGVIKTGWIKYSGFWYYAKANGHLVYGKQVIDGKTYIFDDDAMLRTGTFMWDDKIVTTDGSGAVVSEKDPADGWSYVDGNILYYKNDAIYDGWVGDYLIRYSRMVINDWEYWEGNYYALNEYGKYVKSGWHRFRYSDGYSEYVYAKPGGKLCYNEWYAINGVWYYFDGVYICTDGVYEIDGELHRFDANGKYLGKVTGGDGWKQVGSAWYYLHAGEPVTGVQRIDGKRYLFDDSGVLLEDGFYDMYGEYYYTDSTGAIPNYTGWKKINGQWCYFDSSNLPVLGWFQDNGKSYYGYAKIVDNELTVAVATGYRYISGELHQFSADGVYLGVVSGKSGWFKANQKWYYFRDGRPVNGHQVIDGKNYCFLSGVMVSDYIYNGYYYGKDGVQRTTKGWYKTEEGWIFVQASGKLCNGVNLISGTEYLFESYIMIR